MTGRDFQFFAPCEIYEVKKGDKVERRIAGICSTDSLDREGERIIQTGLDFSEFTKTGAFNNNHSQSMFDVLGVPDKTNPIMRFTKGQTLPNGLPAKTNCTWVTGRLLDTDAGRKVAELGKALQSEGRSLGLSIEGKVVKRDAANKKTIAAAQVSAIAITQKPVNDDTTLNVLAKSMCALEAEWDEQDDISKTMTVGDARVAPDTGSVAGAGSGRLLESESLAGYGKKKKKKQIDENDALKVIEKHFPGTSPKFKSRVLKLARDLKL